MITSTIVYTQSVGVTENPFCPHLGIPADPGTCCAYPSPANTCFAAQPPAAVPLDYQAAVCLCEDHANCPLNKPAQPGQEQQAGIRGKLSAIGGHLSDFSLRLFGARPAGSGSKSLVPDP